MEFAREILLLQEERQKCIAKMNFTKAKEIEENIMLLKAGSEDSYWNERSNSNQNNFEKEKQATLNDLMQEMGIAVRSVYQIRAKHQKDLVEVQTRQAAEMAELTSEFAKDLELAVNRPIPQVSVLERDARSHAQRSHYAMAECLAKEAKQLRAETIKAAQAEIHAKYIEKQEKMIDRHKRFLESFKSKLETSIIDRHLEYQDHITAAKRRLKLIAAKYKQELTDEKVDELVNQYRIVDDEAEDLVVKKKQTFSMAPKAGSVHTARSASTNRAKTPTKRKVRVQ